MFISAILFEGGILLGATTDSSGFTGSSEQSWPFMQLERTVSQHFVTVESLPYGHYFTRSPNFYDQKI